MKTDKKEMPKYEFLLHTWGGFYNEEHKKRHNRERGYHYFDTAEEREKYLNALKTEEILLKAEYLMAAKEEGYDVRIPLIAHRVILLNGKEYYDSTEFPPKYPLSSAQYHITYKWKPGFNSYPAGDVDYSKAIVIQEWFTGAITHEKND